MSATVRDSRSTVAQTGEPLPPAVSIVEVSKTFRIPHEGYSTLKERALHLFRTHPATELRAVDDVTLEIGAGEFFGIVGRNGSGKSTLLKCLAGIYKIDSGAIQIRGRLSPFIELGVGFNPELTARDNVLINAIMLGLSRKQAEERFDHIVAFAELEEFMDLKLKNYSSGMMVRLAFAVAVQVDADILLIDEVLAVGDAAFQQKCFDQFVRLKREGRTIVFVTHDMGAVERFCERAMLLDKGHIIDIGQPAAIARAYNELNFRRVRQEAREVGTGPEVLLRDPEAAVVSAAFESTSGETLVTARQGETCVVRVAVRFHSPIEDPIFSVSLQAESGHTAFATSTQVSGSPTGSWAAGETAIVRLAFENWLGPGRYELIASVARAGFGADLLDLQADRSLIVLAEHSGGGVADLPHTFEIDRS